MRAVEPAGRAGAGPEAGDDPGVGAGTDPGAGSVTGADPRAGEANGATPLVGRPSWLRIEIWRIRHCQRRKASRIRSLARSSRTTFESDCIDPHRYAELRSSSLRTVSTEPDDDSVVHPSANLCQGFRGRIGVRVGSRRLGGNGGSASVFCHDHSREREGRKMRRSSGAHEVGATPETREPPAGAASRPTLHRTAAGLLPGRPPCVGEPVEVRSLQAIEDAVENRGEGITSVAETSCEMRNESPDCALAPPRTSTRPGRRGGRRNRPRGPVTAFIPT